MAQSLNLFILAIVLFIGGHFFLSSKPVRTYLIKSLGFENFRMLYSVYALATLIYLIFAYIHAPNIPPFAFFLMVAGITTQSPTSVYGEDTIDEPKPVQGVLTITRHPMLWGISLWAISHLLAAGDATTIVLMSAFLVLSMGGMVHIDLRREEEMGSRWGPLRLTTSLIPFGAILGKRNTLDWRGIGWTRLLAAVALYVLFLIIHPYIFGVPPLPI